MDLARRIRAARGFGGLSQPELAEELGVSTSTIKRWESGGSIDDLKLDEVRERIAKATGVPLDFLVNGFSEPSAEPASQLDRIEEAVDELVAGQLTALGHLEVLRVALVDEAEGGDGSRSVRPRPVPRPPGVERRRAAGER